MTNKQLKIIIIVMCCCLAAVSALTIAMGIKDITSKTANQNNYQENFRFAQLTYVALGDSITEGANSFDGAVGVVQYPYPALVQINLALKSSVNCGISGSTVASGATSYYPMCQRYVDMPSGDIVSVMGGVNDYARNVPLGTIDDTNTDTFYGALNTLASGLKQKYPNAFIFFMTPYKYSWYLSPNGNGNTLEQFAIAVKDICNKYDLPCLDMYKLGKFEDEMYDERSDGLHPSQNFFVSYTAPQIAQFIRDNFNK